MSNPRISLDQWQALAAVVDTGGYAQAAQHLHKSQSAITYAIKKIEEQLDVPLFTLQGRRAVLTESGQMLYHRGRALLDEATRVEAAAANLAAGWEAEIRLAVDALFPTWLMLDCLAQFNQAHPDIRVELYETVLDGTNEKLLDGSVDLAVTSDIPEGLLGDGLMQIRVIAVASPSHPLHQLNRPVTPDDLRSHRHVMIRDSGSTRVRNPAWQGAHQRWTVSHKATSIHAVCAGYGYTWFAEEIIRKELDRGELKPLPLTEGAERWTQLYLVHADRYAISPGASELDRLIRDAVASCPASGITD